MPEFVLKTTSLAIKTFESVVSSCSNLRRQRIVEQQIKANDPTLPPATLEKTDRTVVTAITKDAAGKELARDQQKVDVYKINLRKDHRIKVGATVVGDKAYETVGYEQNRIEALAQLRGKDIKGATVTWTAIQW